LQGPPSSLPTVVRMPGDPKIVLWLLTFIEVVPEANQKIVAAPMCRPTEVAIQMPVRVRAAECFSNRSGNLLSLKS
jgi:hypothetical protein